MARGHLVFRIVVASSVPRRAGGFGCLRDLRRRAVVAVVKLEAAVEGGLFLRLRLGLSPAREPGDDGDAPVRWRPRLR
jgi:hypothetical protein